MTVPANRNALFGTAGFYEYLYDLQNSIWIDTTPASLSRTHTLGNRRTFTLSAWIKYGNPDNGGTVMSRYISTSDATQLQISNFRLRHEVSTVVNNTNASDLNDGNDITGAWTHFVWAIDTTQAAAADRVKLYKNGIQSTAVTTLAQNTDTYINTATVHKIAEDNNNYCFKIAEVHFFDGVQLPASDFGKLNAYTNTWVPKEYTGGITHGINGFYLPFTNSADLGNDATNGHNLMLYSEEFDNAAWADPTTAWTVVANSETDPDGGSTADVITVTGTTALIRHAVSPDPNTPISFSIWAKVISGTITGFGTDYGDSDSQSLLSQLSAGQWVRCEALNLDNTTANNWIDLVPTFSGAGGEIALWGAQLESATTVGEYIQTTASTITDKDWTLTGITSANQLTDRPQESYPVINENHPVFQEGGSPRQEGGRKSEFNDGEAMPASTVVPSDRKWYWEVTYQVDASTSDAYVGLLDADENNAGALANGWWAGAANLTGGAINDHGSNTNTNTFDITINTDYTVMVAVDVDANKIWFGQDGTWYNSGVPSTGTNATFTNFTTRAWPAVANISGAGAMTATFEFGEKAFAYTAPTGFNKLHTGNFNRPAILKPMKYASTGTYTGTGSPQSITGVGFQPDFVMICGNSATSNKLYDSVRGATKELTVSTDAIETTDANSLTSFDSDGFSVGTGTTVNTNTTVYTYKALKKGVTPGFNIVTWTGNGTNQEIPHGLDGTPTYIIVKKLTTAVAEWPCYHHSLASAAGNYIPLDGAAAATASTTVWNNTAPTSSVFSVGADTLSNGSGESYIAYVFTDVEGFFKAGAYEGNLSADGPVTHIGFEAQSVICKGSGGTGGWAWCNRTDNIDNEWINHFSINASTALQVTGGIDVWSNSFKIAVNTTTFNRSASQMVYVAWARAPEKYSSTGGYT